MIKIEVNEILKDFSNLKLLFNNKDFNNLKVLLIFILFANFLEILSLGVLMPTFQIIFNKENSIDLYQNLFDLGSTYLVG